MKEKQDQPMLDSIILDDVNMDEPSLLTLPAEINIALGSWLDTKSLGALASISKTAYGLFTPQLKPHTVKALLHDVMNSNYVATEKLLKQCHTMYPDLVILKSSGMEKNGRHWDQPISALEFATWIGDVSNTEDTNHQGMVNLLLNYVQPDEREEAFNQMQQVIQLGTQNGFLMAPILALGNAYHECYMHFHQFRQAGTLDDYLVEKIGGLQKVLPRYGLHWLCDKRPFNNERSYEEAPVRPLQLRGISIIPLDSPDLGKDVFIYKFSNGACALTARGLSRVYHSNTIDSLYRHTKECADGMTNIYDTALINLETLMFDLQNQPQPMICG